MKYQIRFTQGEIAGKCFPLSEDKALTIGRSHSNELKLSAPDVSGRHVVLMLSDGGVAMDNLSSRVTLVDSAPLAAAERKTLMAGQTVTMGSSTAFVLECLPDAAPAAPRLGAPLRVHALEPRVPHEVRLRQREQARERQDQTDPTPHRTGLLTARAHAAHPTAPTAAPYIFILALSIRLLSRTRTVYHIFHLCIDIRERYTLVVDLARALSGD